MPAPLRLQSTVAGNDRLWAAEDKARSNTRNVTVDRDALRALLMDHATLLNALKAKGVHYTTPEDST